MTEARAGLACGALAHRSDTMRDREEGGRFVIDSSWGPEGLHIPAEQSVGRQGR